MKIFQKNFLLSLNIPKNFNLVTVFPRLKEEKTRSFATFVMTLTAISVFGFFAINPTLGTIVQLNKQLADSKYVDSQFVEKISSLAQLQNSYGSLKNDVPFVTRAIPSTPNIPSLLGQIQSTAGTSGITLLRLQVQPVELALSNTTPNSYLSFSFSVDASGSTEQLDNFVNGISSLERLITIDNISIAKSPVGALDTDVIKLNVKGRAYFKKL